MKRKVVEFILIFIVFILQCVLYRVIALGGVVPNLPIILVSSFGFMKSTREGMYVGSVMGLFMDVLFGNGLIGLNMLLFIWIGYGNGLFSRLFYPDDLKFPVLFISISDFLYCFATYVLTYLLRSRLDFGYYFLRIMMPELVYTIVATLILYRFILNIEERLEYGEEAGDEA